MVREEKYYYLSRFCYSRQIIIRSEQEPPEKKSNAANLKKMINSCQSTQSDIELDFELGYNDNRLKLCNKAILAIK